MEVVVTVKAVVRVAALNRSNLSNCMFGGGIGHICSICGGGSRSGSGVNSGCWWFFSFPPPPSLPILPL